MKSKYLIGISVLMLLLAGAMPTGAMTMYVDDTRGDSGTTVDVLINATDALDVGAMDIALTYNSSVLSPTGIVNTCGLTVGALVINENTVYTDSETGKETISETDNQTVLDYGALANYTGTDGIVNISIICSCEPPVGFNGAGSVAVVQFRVIGSLADTSPLNLSVAAYNVSAPIPNATNPDKIDGYDPISVALINGTFEAGTGGLPQTGHIDDDDDIDMDDVIYLAKHYYGTDLFPDHGTIYADGDIDCDGDIDMDDVIYLAKHYYGTDLFPDYGTLYPCT